MKFCLWLFSRPRFETTDLFAIYSHFASKITTVRLLAFVLYFGIDHCKITSLFIAQKSCFIVSFPAMPRYLSEINGTTHAGRERKFWGVYDILDRNR